jgi:hypothetical protein
MKLLKYHIIITVLALTCLPTVICAQYLWRSNSVAIDLDAQAGHITKQSDIREGFATIILDVNGTVMEAQISAENGPDAQLHNTTDTLVTEYKLEFDGDGVSETGGSNTEYIPYNSFLSPAVTIKYYPGDNEVAVTLWVKASNTADNVADSGEYSAKQTLTVTWAGN